MHHTVSIDNKPKKVPETVQYYNSSKYGVDVLDQMTRLYSLKCRSCRWPLQVFYNIGLPVLDAIDTQVLLIRILAGVTSFCN